MFSTAGGYPEEPPAIAFFPFGKKSKKMKKMSKNANLLHGVFLYVLFVRKNDKLEF